MFDPRRSHALNHHPPADGPVLYWMSREQRVADNWALYHAQQLALEHKVPLLVAFTLADGFLGATLRQYGFMLRGLEQVQRQLAELAIPFVLLQGEPQAELVRFVTQTGVGTVVCDLDPLRIKRQWFDGAAHKAQVLVVEVDGHNIVPCRIASAKREFGAYTLRPKLKRLLAEFLVEIPQVVRHPFPWHQVTQPFSAEDLLAELLLDRSVAELGDVVPGAAAAAEALADFLNGGLERYAASANDPLADAQSGLSPWLHFGQLAPQRVALQAASCGGMAAEPFLEQLIVRRELSDNFCLHCPDYDRLDCAPDWARRTLERHRHDPRSYCYSLEQFEQAATHDPLWNAAQRQLVASGRIHGYLRMYWAKKMLEWTASPEEAFAIAVQLNDRYALDGRDPNGYTGIAWSLAGVHDRAWGERPVFGTIRFMSADGCTRKFDVADYVKRWAND